MTQDEIRHNLWSWFQDPINIDWMRLHVGGDPSSIIPHLPDSGIYVPEEGWTAYLADKDWSWWGDQVRNPGFWVGDLEVPVINNMLDNLDLSFAVNIFNQRSGRIVGNEHNGTKTVIMLYLSHGHFELLEPLP